MASFVKVYKFIKPTIYNSVLFHLKNGVVYITQKTVMFRLSPMTEFFLTDLFVLSKNMSKN